MKGSEEQEEEEEIDEAEAKHQALASKSLEELDEAEVGVWPRILQDC